MTHLDEETWAAVTAHPDTELYPPASPDALDAFESQHGFRLPASHREFLLRGNGGRLGYARLFGVGLPNALDLAREMEEMRPQIQELAEGLVLPFANNWGGDYFCYARRRKGPDGEYPVLCWRHEYSEEPEDLPMLWEEFAPDFVGFVKKVIA